MSKRISEYGLLGFFIRAISTLVDHWFDWRYSLDTISISKLEGLTLAGGQREHATYYQGTRLLPLRQLLKVLGTQMPQGGALVDLGSGKGKVLLAAAWCGVSKVRGVEFAKELCVVARNNLAAYQARSNTRAAVEIIEGDVAAYAIQPDDTLFYVFNPFDEVILARVMSNIAASVENHPRKVTLVIAFVSSHYERVIQAQDFFRLEQEITTWGYRFSLFSNQVADRHV